MLEVETRVEVETLVIAKFMRDREDTEVELT